MVRILSVLVLVVGACVAPAEDLEPAHAERVQAVFPAGETCTSSNCGASGNSPVIDGVWFWRLHTGGIANPEGFRILDARLASGNLVNLRVTGSRLWAESIGGGTPDEYSGNALVNARIRVGRAGLVRVIVLEARVVENYWGTGTAHESWRLGYQPDVPGGGGHAPTPLCANRDGDPAVMTATIFAGELYTPETRTIIDGAAGWFNVACEYSAPWKLHRMGYSRAANADLGIVTRIGERQAMFKAWTATMCGTHGFTAPGTLLAVDEVHARPLPAEYQADGPVEAIWDANGIVCLGTPRLVERDEVEATCGRAFRTCDAWQREWASHGTVITRVPK